MKICGYEAWWKLAVVVLSSLFGLQLLFNSHVHQITIYTYRLMHDYYRDSVGNMSKYFVLDNSAMLTFEMDENFSTFFWQKTAQEHDSHEWCSPNLSHIFTPENDSLGQVINGGMWYPPHCRPWSSVAIIIPYRWREPHLKHFVAYMHSFLQCQMYAYQIFVVEQYGNDTFNRAKLMNVGFIETRKRHRFDCYIFHDVDLLPLDGYILYNCSDKGPLHMASAIDKWNFRMPYGGYFGGVSGLTEGQILKINGFSNKFFGWGGEDDEIGMRIGFSGQSVQRYSTDIGRYHMFKHGKDEGNDANPQRMALLGEAHNKWKNDGLNTLAYNYIKEERYLYYTKIIVDVSDNPMTSPTTSASATVITTSKMPEKSNIYLMTEKRSHRKWQMRDKRTISSILEQVILTTTKKPTE